MESKENPPPYIDSGPPPHGYAPPPQGYAPPQQGYAPPQQGYAPQQQQGYAPPQQGYAPPQQQGYPQGYAPPPTGYAPPIQTQQQQQSNTTVVIQQPSANTAVVYDANVKDYTVTAILVCIFCFWPTGIVAIYFANRSKTTTDPDEALHMANNARNMIITSVVVGIVWMLILIITESTAY